MTFEASQKNNSMDNNLERQEIELREKEFETLIKNFDELIKDADILEKEVIAGGEFLLVAGGIKPATDIEIPKELIDQLRSAGIAHENFTEDLRLRIERLGLKMSNPRGDNDFTPTSHSYIYNPKLLVSISQKLPALIPFGEDDNIDLWIAENRDTGIDIDFIRGSLFGFPPSSIESFIAYKNNTHGLHELKKSGDEEEKKSAENELRAIRKKEEESPHFIRSYGEVYLAQNPDAADIVKHEQVKKEFFEKLQANKDFWNTLSEIREEVEFKEGN